MQMANLHKVFEHVGMVPRRQYLTNSK